MSQAFPRKPPPELEETAILLQGMIVDYVSACNRQYIDFQYHAHKAAFLLMLGIVRYTEAVTNLAKQDTYMIKPAMSAGRSAFESAVQLLWILHPQEISEREQRWLRYMQKIDDYYRRLIDLYKQADKPFEDKLAEQTQIHGIIEQVSSEWQISKQKKLPDLRGMLKSVGEERKYILYLLLSQIAHSNAVSLINSHGSLAVDELNFEGPDIQGWGYVLLICWWSLWEAGNRFLEISNLPPFSSVTYASRVQQATLALIKDS